MGAQDVLCSGCSGRGEVADFGGPVVAVVPCLDCAGTGLARDTAALVAALPGIANLAAAVATHRLGGAGDEQAQATLFQAARQLLALHRRLAGEAAGTPVLSVVA